MKRLISIVAVLALAASLMLAPASMTASADTVQGIILNQDANFAASLTGATEQGLKDYANSYKGTHVTDYVMTVFDQVAVFPSNVSGVDYIKVLCEAFPAAGINAWLAFDMNDADAINNGGTLSSFYKNNPEVRRVKNGIKTNTYYDNCMDYANASVREYMLGIINSALSNYKPSGIELDFHASMWLWSTGGEYKGLDILNDFMREVDRLVATYETKYSTDIKVSVSVSTDLEKNYELGLDVGAWASEGIIDRVVPANRGVTTNFDTPIRTWTAAMHPFGVEVAPAVCPNIVTGGTANVGTQDITTYSAAAANWFSQGADKVYMYDYSREYNVAANANYNAVINTIGSYDKLMTVDRKMILTYNDNETLWGLSSVVLPKSINKNQTMVIRVPMGDIPANATVTLKLGVNNLNESTPPTVWINSKEANFKGLEAAPTTYTSNKLVTYTVPAGAFNEMYIVAEITPTQYLTVNYVEVFIDAN